ncbi:MAG TPA: hypothetical protein VHK65_13415 [Candidatus Dormibacteraeota bacterium]|nr:hypothetical protein [Candidatus Dormibacteraeota bacterium]
MLANVRALLLESNAPDTVQAVVGASETILEVGPRGLNQRGMTSCLKDLYRWRQRVAAALTEAEVATETMDLYLETGVPMAARTLSAVAELIGPSLLILIGRAGGEPIWIEGEDSVVRLSVPHALEENVAACAVPVISGLLMALLRDERRGVIPATILRHPELVLRTPRQTQIGIPQSTGHTAVLPNGRLSWVAAQSMSGQRLMIYAQSSLTALYLYALPEVRTLTAEATGPVRKAVLGESSLPIDRSLAEPSMTHTSGRPLETEGIHLASRSRKLLVAVVETELRPRASSVRIATAIARHPAADVVICPWHQVHLESDAVRLGGDLISVSAQGAALGRAPGDSARPADALFFYGTSTSGRLVPMAPAARAALERLTRIGYSNGDMDHRGVVQRILHAASERGVVTNGVGLQGWWAIKDHLELMLRAYTRATGRRVARPETIIAAPPQLPTILKHFARRGVDCIVKPADGTQGEGLTVVRPDSPAVATEPNVYVVVQELMPAPFLVRGHKIDLRCYVLIDVDSEMNSKRLPLVLVRRAGVPYRRGRQEAEIANLTYQRHLGLPVEIMPLHLMEEIPGRIKLDILDRLDELLAELVRAHFWWVRAMGAQYANPNPHNRVMVWGVDVLVGYSARGVRLLLLENNVYPQLFRDSEICDSAVQDMFCHDYVPAVIRALGRDPSSRLGQPFDDKGQLRPTLAAITA